MASYRCQCCKSFNIVCKENSVHLTCLSINCKFISFMKFPAWYLVRTNSEFNPFSENLLSEVDFYLIFLFLMGWFLNTCILMICVIFQRWIGIEFVMAGCSTRIGFRKACKCIAASVSWFKGFSRVLPTSWVGWNAGKPKENAVCYLIETYFVFFFSRKSLFWSCTYNRQNSWYCRVSFSFVPEKLLWRQVCRWHSSSDFCHGIRRQQT